MTQSSTPEGCIPLSALNDDLISHRNFGDAPTTTPVEPNKLNIDQLFATEAFLKKIKKQPVVFSPPLIIRLGDPVFFRHTINVIQGQTGVHKSRFSSHLASLLLQKQGFNPSLLDFDLNSDEPNLVVYIDTERNKREQLPFAIQEIQQNAGYAIEEDPATFRYTSLLDTSRRDRFEALNGYLGALRHQTDLHMVIFLDVLTDCVEDFNRADKSLELIDFLNRMINEHNCTFICLIHENPGQGKARGHLGTELINKASTAFQIGFEKDANMEDSDILKIKYLKCRGSAKHLPFYAFFSETEKRLLTADDRDVKSLQKSRQTMAVEADIVEALEELFESNRSLPASELIPLLRQRFNTSEKTIQRRLSELLDNQSALYIDQTHWVLSKSKEGREVVFSITSTEASHE